MELYVLKSVSCLAIFFAFYKIFLERANMHNFKRFYLVGALFAAILIPFITFTSYTEIPLSAVPVLSSEAMLYITSAEVQKAPNYLAIIGWCIYGLGVLFFSVKFGRNLFRMIHKIRKNPHFRDKNIFHVLLNTEVIPHTFFSYIFLNKKKFEASEIPEEVLLHERTHALEKHSLDVLLMEFLQIIFWFNPFIYFIKNSVKLNHEFLADRAVIKNGAETSAYQNILLAFSSNAQSPQLANSINYSSTRLNELFSKNPFGLVKKRFTVMKTHTSKRGFWFRSLLLLPLLAILIFGFSTTEIIEKESTATSKVIKGKEISIKIKNSEVFVNDKSISLKKFANTLDQITSGWSPKEITNCHIDIIVYKGNNELFMEKLEYEYRKTQLYQFKKSFLIPPSPPPPPAPEAATTPKVIIGVNDNDPNVPPPPPPKAAPARAVIKGVNDDDPNVPPPPPPPTASPNQKVKTGNLKLKTDNVNVSRVINTDSNINLNTKIKTNYNLKVKPEIKTNYNIQVKPDTNSPPPPPAPHFKIKKGSKFMLEGKSISYEKAIKLIKDNNYQIQVLDYDSDTPTVKISTEPFVVKKGSKSNIPPPPPMDPMDPMDHIKKMADEGATFFYEDKEVTYNYVIDLVLFNKNLNIQTKTFKSTPPIVYISRDFIFVKGNN